jgi:hypothetical protein
MEMPLPTWPEDPPLGDTDASCNLDAAPLGGIFGRMQAVVEATVPPKPSTTPLMESDSEEEEEEDSSSWESDESAKEDVGGYMELDADMGNTTFSTS